MSGRHVQLASRIRAKKQEAATPKFPTLSARFDALNSPGAGAAGARKRPTGKETRATAKGAESKTGRANAVAARRGGKAAPKKGAGSKAVAAAAKARKKPAIKKKASVKKVGGLKITHN